MLQNVTFNIKEQALLETEHFKSNLAVHAMNTGYEFPDIQNMTN